MVGVKGRVKRKGMVRGTGKGKGEGGNGRVRGKGKGEGERHQTLPQQQAGNGRASQISIVEDTGHLRSNAHQEKHSG